jgi:hypothetical protein
MPTPKFSDIQDFDLHGGPVAWPGDANGFPVIGATPANMKQPEFESLQNVGSFQCRTFCTWKPEDMADYCKIGDYIANGLFARKNWLSEYDEKEGGWRIYMEWTQYYATLPKNPDAIAREVASAVSQPDSADSTAWLNAIYGYGG